MIAYVRSSPRFGDTNLVSIIITFYKYEHDLHNRPATLFSVFNYIKLNASQLTTHKFQTRIPNIFNNCVELFLTKLQLIQPLWNCIKLTIVMNNCIKRLFALDDWLKKGYTRRLIYRLLIKPSTLSCFI